MKQYGKLTMILHKHLELIGTIITVVFLAFYWGFGA